MRSHVRRTHILSLAAAFALAASACANGGGETTASPSTSPQPDSTAPAALLVRGTDSIKFNPTELTAAAGTVTIELRTGGGVPHNVTIEEADDTVVVEAGPASSVTGTIELEPGTYTFYCGVGGHRDAGMEGTLTVT